MLLCKLGPARMRPHRQLAAVLARELRDVGAEVDLERVVPELTRRMVVGASRPIGLQLFARYRDDILIITNAPREEFKRWFNEFRVAAAPFRLLVENVSSVSVPMLDVRICINPDGSLSTSHYIKPTSQKVWLDDTSCNNTGVHQTWPVAHCQRIASICSSAEARRSGVLRFVDGLAHQCPDHIALNNCRLFVEPRPAPPQKS